MKCQATPVLSVCNVREEECMPSEHHNRSLLRQHRAETRSLIRVWHMRLLADISVH